MRTMHRTLMWAATAATLGLGQAEASLIWDGDAASPLSTDVFGNLNCDAPGSIVPDNDPTFGTVWRYSKPAPSNRCENHGIRVDGSRFVFQEDNTYYLGWRSKLSSTVNNNASFQWKSYGNHIQNYPVLLKMINGNLSLMYRAPGEPCCRTIWAAPISPDTWNSHVLGLHLSSVATDGWIEFWFNGVQQTLAGGVLRYPGRTLDDINEPKWGIYGASATDVTNFVHGVKVGTTYEDVALAGGGGPGGPTPTPTPTPPGLRFEGERIPRMSVGAPTAVQNDARNSGGQWMALLADSPGDYVEYTLASVPRGTYDVSMKYKSHPSRGILSMTLDGQPLGPESLDQYSNPPAYPEIALGTVRFDTGGDHIIRQTALGKNPASSSLTLSADLFVLMPDLAAPVIELPDDFIVEATGPGGAVVTFAATANDNKDGIVPVTLAPDSGSLFPLGTTTVTASAVDFHGNTATDSFLVTVVDTTPPILTVPTAITAEATSPAGAIVTFAATAIDIVSGSVAVSFSVAPGSIFPLGTTTVVATATDAAGNTGTGSFTVTVVDTTAPAITVPPNVTITTCDRPDIGQATATDAVGTPIIGSDAPPLFALGITYVTWRAVDPSGNAATGVQTVTVELGDDASCCPAGTKVYVGTNGNDVIRGTAGSDCILGRGGNDIIDALGGDDFISGGAGNDTIAAGLGDDLIMGGPGDDVIDASLGDDIVRGGPGRDTIAAALGNDDVDGGPGTDVCAVAPDGHDVVVSCP
jgi:Ca2+-binding RTX toxin-like protein